ncbi:MAG: phosphate signaling complex protein PhoU [Planctomycetes bacterium]|nr:phosphate signaling complex protein PhoU [Planctomycetota bacterium]
MERHLDHDLDTVRQLVLRMGGLVEKMLVDCMKSLVDRDSARGELVIRTDIEVDLLEKEIDEHCLSILARYQPTATDLRLIAAVMKLVNDLERMGDSAVNIAQAAAVINQEPPLKPYIDLPRLALLVQKMVRESLDSLVQRNSKLAYEICKRDDEIDNLYKQLFRELLCFMIEDPKTVTRALHLLLVARNLERIADHATNISEDVIYYVEGRDIRHMGAEIERAKSQGIGSTEETP